MEPKSTRVLLISKREGTPSATDVAESVPGPGTHHFAALAKELGIYLCIGLIETASNRFYNTQALLSPSGELVAHHRKKALWPPGDATWCSQGDRPAQVVDTEFGRLGLMICYDYNVMPSKLKDRGADMVLYSVGWYGPNEKNWFTVRFPRDYVATNIFAVIAANWSASGPDALWPGAGYSCVIARDGTVLASTDSAVGNAIVIADVEIGPKKK